MSNLKLIVPDKETKEIKDYQSSGTEFVTRASHLLIATKEDVESASEIVGKINDRLKEIEAKRLEFTKPLNQSLKSINETFKEAKTPFEDAKRILTGKLTDWHIAEEKRIREENEKREREEMRRRKIQESHAERGHETGDVPVVDSIAPKQNKIGRGHTVKRWTFEVEDFSKVPDKYKTIYESMVREAIRKGEREIPGLRIFQETSVIIR